MQNITGLKVIITGATGFIGSNMARRLVKRKAAVHIIHQKTSQLWRLKDFQKDIFFHNQSILEKEQLTKLIKSIMPNVIYHFAAYGSSSIQTDPEKMIAVNITGTLNLLLASLSIPYTCFVNTGSSSEYGLRSKPMREDDGCFPTSFYGAAKLAATNICRVFAKTYKKPIITLRPFSVYGPYEGKNRLIPTLMKALIKNTPIKLTSGLIRHDFVFIEDVIDCYLAVLEKNNLKDGDIFNLGTGLEYTNEEVAAMIFAAANKKTTVEKGAYPKRAWDSSHWVADMAKTKKMLGFNPHYSLKHGLGKTYEWFKNNISLYDNQ